MKYGLLACRTPPRGYLALVSVLIICSILTALVFESATGVYFARFSADASENKRAARQLTRSCMAVATVRLTENDLYRPGMHGDKITVAARNDCIIGSIQANTEGYTVRVHAQVQDAWYTETAQLSETSAGTYMTRSRSP